MNTNYRIIRPKKLVKSIKGDGSYEKTIKVLSEYHECLAYFKWAQSYPIVKDYLIKHVNEAPRTMLQAHYLTLIGLRRGLPDYQLPISNKNWKGFWLEMKTLKGHRLREDQVSWIRKLKEIGQYADFSYGAEDAIKKTIDYLEDKI